MSSVKRITSVIITAVLLISVFIMPSVSVCAISGDNCSYKLLENGTAEVTGCSLDYDELNIPNTIDGYTVTSIGDSAFYSHGSLKKVTIPDSVIRIGMSAFFGCNELTDITIPDSVISIGMSAFGKCRSLKSLTIPKNVKSIGECLIDESPNVESITVDTKNKYFSSIDGNLYNKDKTVLLAYAIGKTDKSFSIPDSVTKIESFAFECCTKLNEIIVPDSVKEICSNAFRKCTNLISVTVGKGITEIYNSAFEGCKNLVDITLPDVVIKIGENAFYDTSYFYDDANRDEYRTCYIGKHLISGVSGKIIVKDGTLDIAEEAFSSCKNLSEVTIPNSVEIIGN